MELLGTPSSIVRVTPGVAGSLHITASYADNNAGSITVAAITPIILTTTTTTTIIPAPGSGVQRNIKHISIHNNGSVSPSVLIEQYDGTNAAVEKNVTLQPQESIRFDGDVWRRYDANGAEYTSAGPIITNLGATGTLAETIPRELCPEVNTTAGASGTLFLQAIYLAAGTLVSAITIWSATTAAGTPTNRFFALYDGSRNLLAQSANDTTNAWSANSKKTLSMTTPYRIPVSGLYYIGLLQTATTIATIKGGTAKTGGQLAGDAPILNGTSSTGLSTTLPNPAAAITVGTASIYAAVS